MKLFTAIRPETEMLRQLICWLRTSFVPLTGRQLHSSDTNHFVFITFPSKVSQSLAIIGFLKLEMDCT